MANDGTVPQYYVEDSHPAIIAPEQFALVQDIFAERARDAVIEQIDQIMIRRRKIERFIENVKDLPGVLTSFASIRFPHEFGKLSRSAARPSPIKTRFDGTLGPSSTRACGLGLAITGPHGEPNEVVRHGKGEAME